MPARKRKASAISDGEAAPAPATKRKASRRKVKEAEPSPLPPLSPVETLLPPERPEKKKRKKDEDGSSRSKSQGKSKTEQGFRHLKRPDEEVEISLKVSLISCLFLANIRLISF